MKYKTRLNRGINLVMELDGEVERNDFRAASLQGTKDLFDCEDADSVSCFVIFADGCVGTEPFFYAEKY